MAAALHFPAEQAHKLDRHLPPAELRPGSETTKSDGLPQGRPFVTLTFATSLDSSLSLAPGTTTLLSGPESKAMTHFLRSQHDAICVGVGTAVADDPGLNCRLGHMPTPVSQPRPIVIDPDDRWQFSESSKVLRLAREGIGLAPFIITAISNPVASKLQLLESHGGKYICIRPRSDADQEASDPDVSSRRFHWADILAALAVEGIRSVMIEGGGNVINSLLDAPNCGLVDSVIVTIAPTWLGQGGVVVSPSRAFDGAGNPRAAARLSDVSWLQLGEDIVLCGKIR